jgi:protoheme IX farnesyltransferase
LDKDKKDAVAMGYQTQSYLSTASSHANWRDYLEMCKPKVVLLMLLTSMIGMFMAVPGMVALDLLVLGNLGIALCAGSAATLNHVIDRRIDGVMARTHKRPLATGRVDVRQALIFAFVIGSGGTAILILFVNSLTAVLTCISLLGYAVIYTVFLKRLTPQNIVIGGLAGAMPPLLGWVAVTGSIDANALLLVLIIFAWTPPHFWALAIHRKDEYAKAGIPMLPVTHGVPYTALFILLYTLMMFAVSLLPFVTQMSGMVYLLSAIGLGLGFIYWSVVLYFNLQAHAAIKTFKYSIWYLMVLFIMMLLDHYWFFSLEDLLYLLSQ